MLLRMRLLCHPPAHSSNTRHWRLCCSQFPGAEEALLRELSCRVVDAATQLVVLCELCARPATKECWTCSMSLCSFCTRRQHVKVRGRGSSHLQHPNYIFCCS